MAGMQKDAKFFLLQGVFCLNIIKNVSTLSFFPLYEARRVLHSHVKGDYNGFCSPQIVW